MGIGHSNTEAEQKAICCSFGKILKVLKRPNSDNISRAEWSCGTSARDGYAGGEIIGGKKTRRRSERPAYPGILQLMHEVQDAILQKIRSNNSLKPADWAALLKEHPEYVNYCCLDMMSGFRAEDWLALIRIDYKRFSRLCKASHGFHKFYSRDMADLLVDFPTLAEECLVYRMTLQDWLRVVQMHPEVFALYNRQRLHSDASVFNLRKFIEILEAVPRETWRYVDWAQFTTDGCNDWQRLLIKFPELGPALGKARLPDDLLEAVDKIICDGHYDPQKYDWIHCKLAEEFFSAEQLKDSGERLLERVTQHPELRQVPIVFSTIKSWFGKKYPSLHQTLEAYEMYHETYPGISELLSWDWPWKNWKEVLTKDYARYIDCCFEHFSSWCAELMKRFVGELNPIKISSVCLGKGECSLLREKDLERFEQHVAMYWLEYWDKKRTERERKAERKRKANEAIWTPLLPR